MADDHGDIIVVAGMQLDRSRGILAKDGRIVPVRAKAFELLSFLVRNTDRVISKQELIEAVWGRTVVTDDALTQTVKDLRKALGDSNAEIVRTLPRRGYLLSLADKRSAQQAHDCILVGAVMDTRSLLPTVEVFRFAVGGENAEEIYLAEGIREDLVAALSRFSGLVVLAQPQRPESQTASTKSRATYVLTGSARRVADRVRIVANLVTSEDESIWADKFDFDLIDVFAVQDELARRVSAALNIVIGDSEQARALKKATLNLNAHDLCQRARHIERSHERTQRKAARDLFVAAIDEDPSFVQAHVGLAWYEIRNLKWSEPLDHKEALARARSAARKAAELDPRLMEAHWALGVVSLWLREPTQAVAHYERARELAPNHTDLLADYCDSLTYLGRFEDAIAMGDLAVRLNPNQPDWYIWNVAAGHYLARRYLDAMRYLERMVQPGPAYRLIAATCGQLGRLDEAEAAANELLKINPEFSISRFAARAPYLHRRDLDHYVAGLQLAKLPE